MTIVKVAPGLYMDDDPVGLSDIERELAKIGAPLSRASRFKGVVYPYVVFHSLERAGYGLTITEDKPHSKTVDTGEERETTFEILAPINDLDDAVEILERGDEIVFEEMPFVEVLDEKDYARVAAAAGDSDEPEEWEPGRGPHPRTPGWEGPGVYDLRDSPPSRALNSVEEYEEDSMESMAFDIVDFMFQSDEWRDALRDLVARNLGRTGTPEGRRPTA